LAGGRATTSEATVTDPRRRVPRTDAVLADPALADALARLARDEVKRAVAAAQHRVRAGEVAPEGVVGVPSLPRCPRSR